jgi:hypothetical protein
MNLTGEICAAIDHAQAGILEERNRGFASDREAWAELKEKIENAVTAAKSIEKLHKEMWDAVLDKNDDAFCVLAQELQRAAGMVSIEWALVSAAGKIAVEYTEE